MAIGNNILAIAHANGRFDDGFLGENLYPGTCVQVDWSVAVNGGRYTYDHYDGNGRHIKVLLPANLKGQLRSTQMSSGDQCILYTPLPGDELNMLVKNIAGSGDSFEIGDLLEVDSSTGKLIAATGSVVACFQVLETVAAITADTLIWCKYIGGAGAS